MYTPVFLTKGQFDEAIAQSKRELLQDFKDGIVPFNVPDLSGCHDYLDGNYYGGTGVMEGGDYDKLSKLADAARVVETGYRESFETDRCEDDDSVTQRYMADTGAVHDMLNDYITSGDARRNFDDLAKCEHDYTVDFKPHSPTHLHWEDGPGFHHALCTCSKCIKCGAVTTDDHIHDRLVLGPVPTCLGCLTFDLQNGTVWPGDTLNIVEPDRCENMAHHG
jgi:hypothetical protein